MNILIPMAGAGIRFLNNGYDVPKPLIEVNGKSMIERAIESLEFDGKLIFIVKKYEEGKYNNYIEKIIKKFDKFYKKYSIDFLTEGPACSCLIAKEEINNQEELIIANCDQIMEWNGENFLNYCRHSNYDGVVVTYTSNTNKNSYAKINNKGYVTEIAEKRVISDISLNGIHYWREGKCFVESAEKAIKNNDRVNNEFYVAPTFNYMIKDNKKIGIYHIPNQQHNPIGTPEDLKNFLRKNEHF